MRIIIYALIFYLTALSPHCSFAQEKIYFGAFGTYEFGSPTAINREVGIINVFSTHGQGVSWDNAYGIGLKIQLPSLFNNFGLGFGLRYSKGSGVFKSIDFSTNGRTEQFKIFSYYHKLEASASVLYDLSSKWYLRTGLWGQFRLDSIAQHEIILSQDTFSTGTKDNIIASGNALATSKFHLGIPIVIGGRFPISNSLFINPEVFSRIDIEELYRGFGISALSYGASVGILFDLEPPPTIVSIPQPAQKESLLRTAIFLNVNGVSVKKTEAHIIDTLWQRYITIPMSIDFSNEAELSKKFQILPPQEALSFDLVSLDRSDLTQCYRNILNIIGKRLCDFPKETLILSSATQWKTISVAHYLNTIFGINTDRIVQRKSNDSVVLIGGSMKVLSPLINQWHDEYRQTPEITIDKLISSTAPIKNWRISVKDGESIIGEYSNQESAASSTVQSYTIDANDHTITAHLIAADSIGNRSEAYDSLKITTNNASQSQSETQVSSYILLADSIATQTSWSAFLLEQIVKACNDHQTISIRPLSSSATAAATISIALFDRLKKVQCSPKYISIIPATSISGWSVLNSAVEVRCSNE